MAETHYCSACGEQHGGGGMPPDVKAQIEIARLNADRDVQVARIQARMEREALETTETVAETEAEAQVLTAEALADAPQSADLPDEPEVVPVVIDTPQEEAPAEAGTDLPPAEEHHEPHDDKPKKPASKSWF